MICELERIRPDVILVRVRPADSFRWPFGFCLDFTSPHRAVAKLAHRAPTPSEYRLIRRKLLVETELNEVTWERRTIADDAVQVRIRREVRGP